MSGPLRTVASWALALATTALAVTAIAGVWWRQQLLDTDTWTRNSVEVLRDPQVQERTATFLAAQLGAQQDAIADVAARLPEPLRSLGDTATAALRETGERVALQVLENRSLEPLWADASRTTHEQFVRWLAGEDVARDGAVIVLDLQPAMERLARRVGIPEPLIAAGAATGRAEIEIVQAGQYDEVRAEARRLERASDALVPLTLAAAILSVAVARRRRWAMVRIGAAIAAAGGIVLLLAPWLGDRLTEDLVAGGAAPLVANAVWATIEPSLSRSGTFAAVGGGLLAVLALATLRSRRDPPRTTRADEQPVTRRVQPRAPGPAPPPMRSRLEDRRARIAGIHARIDEIAAGTAVEHEAEHETDDPDHDEDRAHRLELDPAEFSRDGESQDRPDGDEEEGATDGHA